MGCDWWWLQQWWFEHSRTSELPGRMDCSYHITRWGYQGRLSAKFSHTLWSTLSKAAGIQNHYAVRKWNSPHNLIWRRCYPVYKIFQERPSLKRKVLGKVSMFASIPRFRHVFSQDSSTSMADSFCCMPCECFVLPLGQFKMILVWLNYSIFSLSTSSSK